MDMHASRDQLPELQAFLGSFRVCFRRPEGAEALERYRTGLLTELPKKNCDTIAQAVPGASEQRFQEFLTNMPWDEEDLHRQRVQKMIREATLGDGELVFDDTGFPKLDFGQLCGIAQGICKALKEGPRDFHHFWLCTRGGKMVSTPQGASHQCNGVGKGRPVFRIPGSRADGGMLISDQVGC